VTTTRIYQNSVQLIGLGSAGTNIVETFMTHEKTMDLMKNDITRLSLLAIDIADPEIRALEETNERIVKAMAKSGIPHERMRLIAQSVKFPTAEAMFDFINQKYNEYLVSEGCKIEKFVPWLHSTMAIPPMAGGAGRRRALAKAIYALNYYQLGIIRNCINAFKEQALSSIITPTVILVYGLGGGTGSGIFFDFARHLRKVLGSGVPIIAFVVTPCGGDDPPAKGCSAFVAMNELQLLVNKEYNEYVTKVYGEYYRNPLNALIYLPLLPAYTKAGNIVTARHEIDDMFVDLLYILMDFDLADLMGGIGTEVGLTENSAHTLGMVKVMYPVNDYIAAYKLNFEKLQMLYDLRKEKLEILDGINEILTECNHEVKEMYKDYLIKTGTFNEEQFDEKVKSVIYSNPRLEDDMMLHVKGIEIQARNWMDEQRRFLSTIKRMGKSGPIEEAVINLSLHKEGSRKIDNLESLLTNLTKTHLEFCEQKAEIFERLKQLIPSSQVFTVRQKRLLEDFMSLADIAEKSLNILKFYDHTRYLADTLMGYCSALPEEEANVKGIKEIMSELATIYLAVQLMLRTPGDEAKMIEEHAAYLNEIVSKRLEKRNLVDNEAMRVQEAKRRKEFDRSKMEAQLRKTFSSKRYAREQLIGIERELKRLTEEEAIALDDLAKMDSTIKMYDSLAKRLGITADYRKRLNKIVGLEEEYEEKMRQIVEPKKYFERSSELTENEQMRIIFKILMEQEETLTEEKILREIVDKDHYKDFMKSLIRVFKTPSVMGYKPIYKSDYIWVTVVTPPSLWNEELSQELYTSLAGYVTSEVSRTITVRVIESRDAWTTRILVVGGRGKPSDMEAYDEMQLLYSKSNDFERQLSRSMLIEHGVAARQIVDSLRNGNNGASIEKK
jgi:hypothetical protein